MKRHPLLIWVMALLLGCGAALADAFEDFRAHQCFEGPLEGYWSSHAWNLSFELCNNNNAFLLTETEVVADASYSAIYAEGMLADYWDSGLDDAYPDVRTPMALGVGTQTQELYLAFRTEKDPSALVCVRFNGSVLQQEPAIEIAVLPDCATSPEKYISEHCAKFRTLAVERVTALAEVARQD